MKLISARSSCAPAPISIAKRAPEIFVARSKSRMPSAGPRSQCGLRRRSRTRRGSPHVRTTTLSAALLPVGHALVRQVGNVASKRAALLFDGVELDLELLDLLCAQLVRLEDRPRVQALPLRARNLVAGRVLLALEPFDLRNDARRCDSSVASCSSSVVRSSTARRDALSDEVGVLSDEGWIEHEQGVGIRDQVTLVPSGIL